jgi:hypothetical protein
MSNIWDPVGWAFDKIKGRYSNYVNMKRKEDAELIAAVYTEKISLEKAARLNFKLFDKIKGAEVYHKWHTLRICLFPEEQEHFLYTRRHNGNVLKRVDNFEDLQDIGKDKWYQSLILYLKQFIKRKSQ